MAAARHSAATDPGDVVLPLLENARPYGNGWRTDCPTGHSSRGTLSVAVGDDGRLLMHCFSCNDTPAILAALGLTVADLYPQHGQSDLSPADRSQRRELVGMAHWRAAIGVLGTEASVIEVAARMIERGDTLAADDMDRVRLAAHRIHCAREVLQ